MAAVSRPGTLQTWLQPPVASKRKRDSLEIDDDVIEVPTKKASTSGASSVKKQPAKPKPVAAAKPASSAKEAKKLYTEAVKTVDKRHVELDKKVKAMSPNSRAITVTNYATSAAKHLPTAKKLASLGDANLAFNFVMTLADSSHRNIWGFKFSGESGSCQAPFERMDAALLELIDKREQPTATPSPNELPSVPHRWSEEDADVGVFKTGRPKKQQRNAMDRQYIDWEKERRAERRSRRADCEDWVQVALADLKEDRDYLSGFGVGVDFDARRSEERNAYFAESIKKMEAMIAERTL